MIKDFFRGFVLQLQFLTRIPMPINICFDEKTFSRGVVFAPVVGLLIGAAAVGVYMIAGLLEKRMLAVLAALITGIAVTGGLHLDGVADTFDGLFSHRDPEKILAVMNDSRLGTFGALALIVMVLLKFVMLISISDKHLIGSLLIMPALSRMTIAWSASLSPYARKNGPGLAAALVENTGAVQVAVATIISLIIGISIFRLAAVPLTSGIIIFAVLAGLYMKRRIGGVTGDVIGAVIELSEVLFLAELLVMEVI
jgi:adenosylcobinamide-GDP ribazoletransferase